MEGGRYTGSTKSKKGKNLSTGSKQNQLLILYTNAQSIVNKVDELRGVACTLTPDIIMITESWTHDGITKAYLTIPDYEIVARKDRTDTADGRGGGLLVYRRSGLTVVEEDVDSEFNQLLSVSVQTSGSPLLINLVYRSPNSNSLNNAKLDEFTKSLESSSMLIGDMNYRGIDWENGISDSEGRQFFNATQDAFLQQYVSFPTHEGNLLDLVLASNDIGVLSVEDAGNLGKSHHSMLLTYVDANPSRSRSTELIPDYSKADFSKLRELMSIDWCLELADIGAQDGWTLFKETLAKSIENCIPLKNRRSDNKPLWMNKNIMRTIRKKRRLWNKYKTTNDYFEYLSYLDIQKQATKLIRSAKRKFERRIAKNMKKNPRQFYAHLNSKTKSRTNVGPLQTDGGARISDSQGMSNILNTFFTSVFTKEDVTHIPVPKQMCNAEVSSLTVSEEFYKATICYKKEWSPWPRQNQS